MYISIGVVYHVEVQFDDIVQDDSPLLVNGVVLNPVLFLSLEGLLHLDFLSGPSFNVDHQSGDSLYTLTQILSILHGKLS